MMKHTIDLDNLENKSIIRFAGKGIEIDFLHKNTNVKVFFNGNKNPTHDIFAQLLVAETNQRQTTVFELNIPEGAQSANIILASITKDYDLTQIQAVAFE